MNSLHFAKFNEICEHLTSVTIWVTWIFGPYWTQSLFCAILFSGYYYVALLYLIYMYFDYDSMRKGGKLQPWLRGLSVWDSMLKYFPVTFHKTAELDPTKNYIIGCHPHGIAVYGTGISFNIYEKHFRKLFPGITVRVCMHNVLFWLPLLREIVLLFGSGCTDKKSIEYIISKMGKGNATAIIIGGGKEFFSTSPQRMKLTLKDRKGFVKIALKNGASLVPCICFGENELFATSKTRFTFLFKQIQRWATIHWTVQILCVIPFMLLYTVVNFKTVFNVFSGSVKHRKHLHTIIGKPINVTKNENPSDEEIDVLHQKYIKSLCDLFYSNREKYAENPNQEIVIV